jgi:DNA-binding beta-propeller fold protein YncE
VLDADSGQLVGQVLNTPAVHGAAIAPELGRGFTSNGDDRTVTVFDTKTFELIKKVPVQAGTNFILSDSLSKRVFPLNEHTTVFDGRTGGIVGTLDLGGDPEAAVSDGKGTVYINLGTRTPLQSSMLECSPSPRLLSDRLLHEPQ